MIGKAWRALEGRHPGLASQLRNGSALAASQGGDAVLRGVYALVIGALLGATGYGVWSYVATAYAALLAVTSLGIETLVEANAGRDRDGQSRLAATTLGIRLVTVAFAGAALALAALLLESDPLVRHALWLAVPALIGRGLASWCRSFLTAREAAGLALRVALPFRIAEVGLGVALLFAGMGITVLLALHALSWLLEAMTSYLVVRRLQPGLAVGWSRSGLKLVLRQGLPIGLTVAGIAVLNGGPVVLSKFNGITLGGVGNLGLALQVAALGIFVVQGFMAASFPVLSRAADRGDPRLLHYAWGWLALAGAGSVVAAGIAWWLGEPIVLALLGQDFADAAAFLPLALLLAGMCIAPTGFWQVMVVRGQAWAGAIAAGLAALVMAVAMAPLVNGYGLQGALLAGLLGWLVRALLLVMGSLFHGVPRDQKST